MTHDLLVVGAGAGGLSAARAGVRAGWRTGLVTNGPVGGDCTFTGCIPSKTLIEAAAAGVPAPEALARVRATVARVAATESADVLRGEGIDVVVGGARFLDPHTLAVHPPEPGTTAVGAMAGPPLPGDRTLSAPRIVIAAGAVTSWALPVARPAVDGPDVLTTITTLSTHTVFDLDDAPRSLAVVGGGPAGCELAQAFARLGSRVTLVEGADRLLPGLDADAGAAVAGALRRDGVTVRLGATTTTGEVLPDRRIRMALSAGEEVEVDQVLGLTGRRPDTAHHDAHDRPGVELGPDGRIVVDDHLATTVPGVFAVGDVTGLCPHTHAADEMGRIAVHNLDRPGWRRRRFRPDLVPRVVFTDPEVATIGLTEAEAQGRDAWVAEIPMSAVDRAITAGREDGFVRLVAAPLPGTSRLSRDGLWRVGGGRLLGATIVAPRAGEMIAEVALAMRIGALTGRLAQTVHAYPTWTLAVRQAAAALATRRAGDATVRRAGRP